MDLRDHHASGRRRNRAWLVITALVCVLAVCAGLLSWFDRADNEQVLKSDEDQTSPGPNDESDKPGVRRAGSRDTEPASVTGERDDSEQVDAFEDQWLEGKEDRGGPVIRIWDSEDTHGVAGATVAFLPFQGSFLERLGTQGYVAERFIALAREGGFIFETDERGYCSLPYFNERGALIAASPEGMLGPEFLEFADDAGRVIHYNLWKAAEYALRIVDENDRPVEGVGVSLQVPQQGRMDAQGNWDARTGLYRDHLDALTDGEGIARFTDARASRSARLRFVVRLPTARLRPITASPLDTIAEIPTLKLRAMGAMVLTVLTPEGLPFEGRIRLAEKVARAELAWTDPTTRRDIESSGPTFTLDTLALGGRVAFTVTAADGSYASSHHELAGPDAERRVAKAEVRLGETCPTISMTLMRTDRTRGAHLKLRLRATRRSDPEWERRFGIHASDRFGNIKFGVRLKDLAHPDTILEATVVSGDPKEFSATESSSSSIGHRATAVLPISGREIRNFDLGRIQLRAPPLLAAGRILDERGAPVSGVSIRAVNNLDWDHDWMDSASALGDRKGRFELTSHRDSGTFHLLLKKPGWPLLTTEALKPGVGPLELRYPRGGRVALEFSSAIKEYFRLDVELIENATPEYHREPRLGRWVSPRRVIWSGIAPGKTSIRIDDAIDDQGKEFVIEDIVIESDREAEDPRLRGVTPPRLR